MEMQSVRAVDTIGAQERVSISGPAFEQLFKTNFKRLFTYALTIVREEKTAEEMVQNVFYKIWERKGYAGVQTSITAYLYKSVYHESLNYLKHIKVKNAYEKYAVIHSAKQENNAAARVQISELQQKLDIALSELPEQCRTIFQMSRFEELKYQEIAGKLGLSVKTIENQMGKALRILRSKLADYLPLIIGLLLENLNTGNLC